MAYESGWSPIAELQTGAEVNVKFGNAFANVDAGLGQITPIEEELIKNAPVFLHDTANDIAITTAGQWYGIGTIDEAQNPAGTYQYSVTIDHFIDDKTSSAIFRVSEDGGTVWKTFEIIAHTVTNDNITSFSFVREKTLDQGLQLLLQATKEDQADEMTVNAGTVIIEKKLGVTP